MAILFCFYRCCPYCLFDVESLVKDSWWWRGAGIESRSARPCHVSTSVSLAPLLFSKSVLCSHHNANRPLPSLMEKALDWVVLLLYSYRIATPFCKIYDWNTSFQTKPYWEFVLLKWRTIEIFAIEIWLKFAYDHLPIRFKEYTDWFLKQYYMYYYMVSEFRRVLRLTDF